METSLGPIAPAAPRRELRPMGIGDLLDRAILFYRMNFVALVVYAALFTVPVALVTAALSLTNPALLLTNPTFEPDAPLFGAALILSYVGFIVLSLISVLLIPAQVAGVGVAMRGFLLEGRRVTLREMIAGVRANLRPLLATGLVALILQLLLFVTFLLPPVGAAISTLFNFAFYLCGLVVLYERRQGLPALRRGWLLIRGSVWRALGYFLLFYLFSLLFGLVIGGLLGAGGTALLIVTENPLLLVLIQTLATSVTGVLSTPLVLAVVALLYFDLRIRHEGLDLALAAAQAAGEPVDLAALPVSDAPVLDQATWRPLGILSGIYTLVFMAFCGLCVGFFFLIGAAGSALGSGF